MTKTIKKIEKAKARRKDFVKRKNILKTRPTIKKSYKKPVYKQEIDRKGVVKVVQIDEKEVLFSVKGPVRVSFPKSKKFKEKKQKNK